jgi:hypothetical protein
MSLTKQVSLHGTRAFVSTDDDLVGRKGLATGGAGKPSIVFPSNDTVAQFDDFLGDVLADEWAAVLTSTDTGASAALISKTNGIFRTTTSDSSSAPTDAIALTQGLFKNWKANQGPAGQGRLRLTARVKSSVVSTAATSGRNHLFIGFSDSGGAEAPAYDTGIGVISNAADLVGFLFSPSGQNTDWTAVAARSTAGDSGDQLVATGVTPVSNVYTTLEVEVRSGPGDTGGTAHFWVDGVPVAKISSPVGSAVAMTPWIGQWVQDTGFQDANWFDIDCVNLSAPRDTGE